VYNKGVAMPIMTNVSAAASGGTSSTNHGVYNDTSSPTMTNVSAAASGGGFACGVFNQTSSPTMFSVNASGSGGTNNHGMCNTASSATIHNSVITGSGGASSDGISSVGSGGPYTVTVDASQITGSTNTISQSASYTSLIGASKLDGGAVQAFGTYTCTASYNGSYAALPAACR
jgi:hypothetical protein